MRVYEDGAEAPLGFVPVAPTLEDAYLLMMRQATVPV